MMKYVPYLFFFTVFANISPVDVVDNHQIAVQNSILAKVNGNSISVIDVKKKMDLVFYKNYGHLAESNQARHQFYEGSWRFVLKELVDQQLILAKAQELQIPLSDGDVRSEIETRFGPNIMITLDKIGLTYDEAFKMIREEMIVQRMTGWFIHSKAINQVTPQQIRQAYQKHLKENPGYEELQYQVITIRGQTPEETAKVAHALLREKELPPAEVVPVLQKIDPSIQVSALYTIKDIELSDLFRSSLTGLKPGDYSEPVIQKSKNGSNFARIFYLQDSTSHPAPQFESLVYDLRNELMQKAVARESESYMAKLRKDYPLYENTSEDLHPFILK